MDGTVLTRYRVELLRPMVSVELDAESEAEAHAAAVAMFTADVTQTPMRVVNLDEDGD